jgi:hypothetical protein
MAVVPFPTSLSAAVSAALADDAIDGICKDHLRALADSDARADVRAEALQGLMEHLTTLSGSAAGWKLVPALTSIAADRDGPEQAAILVCAAHLEVGRLVLGDGDTHVVSPTLIEARHVALRLAGTALAQPVDDEAMLRPLLVVVAAFNGLPDLAMALLEDDEDFDEEEDDDEEEEEEEEGSADA